MTKFHFVTVVWGEAYTNFYLRIVLPTQLSPGNLHYFQGMSASSYHIYTTSKDIEVIKNVSSYAVLSEYMPVEIHLIDGLDLTVKYQAMIECHKRAIQNADKAECAIIFLSPDAIYSDGTFMHLVKLAEKGIEAVMVAGIRVAKETFTPSFLERHRANDDLSISISSRQLVKIAMKHLHPFSILSFWNSKSFTQGPSHLYWKVDDEGLLARCFHLHPLMVNPSRRGVLPSGTIDDDYILLSCQSPAHIHVVSDSDEIAICEVSASNQFGDIPHCRSSVWRVAIWVAGHTDAIHRNFFRNKIRFHSEDISSRWEEVEHDSEDVIGRILRGAGWVKAWQTSRLGLRLGALRSGLGVVKRSMKRFMGRNEV